MENGGFSPFGTPIANSTRSLLSPRPGSSSSNHSTGSSSVSSSHKPIVQRLKGQDLYGGPVTFGGGNASTFFRQRRERLLAASPYGGTARKRYMESSSKVMPSSGSDILSSGASNGPPASSSGAPADSMSSTAKLILDTLERMSTPLRDARKIPVSPAPDMSRAEKRRLIAEELDSSLLGGTPGLKRKRPNLRASGSSLNGPPVRTCFSPVLNRTKKSAVPEKKAPPAEKPKEEVPKSNGVPWTGGEASMASSIKAFNSTVLNYGESQSSSSAGGKLRIKDTAGPRSGRLLASSSNASPVKAPTAPRTNGWSPPPSVPEKRVPFQPPTVVPTLSPPPPPPVVEEKTPSSLAAPLPVPMAVKAQPLPPPKADHEPSEVFTFSEPQKCSRVLCTSSEMEEAEKDFSFTFSNPKILAEECSKEGASSPSLMNGHEPSRKLLPDITSFSAFGGDVVVGSKGSLPDITVSPGQLKKGSVLSVLSKMQEPSNTRNARL